MLDFPCDHEIEPGVYDPGKPKHRLFPSTRLFIYLISTLGSCIIGILFSSFNFGWVCMVNGTTTDASETADYGGTLLWDEATQRFLFSCYSIGGLVMALPIGILTEKFGSRIVYSATTGIGGLATFFIPLAAHKSLIPVVAVLRILVGIGCSGYWQLTFAICSFWAPGSETGLALAIVCSGSQVGQFAEILFAGMECHYIGWDWLFYIVGIASITFSFLWFVMYREDPLTHPFISANEANYIVETRNQKKGDGTHDTPWLKMLLSLAVWSCIICRFLGTYVTYTVNTFTPTYLKQTSTLSPSANGYLSSLPLLFQLIGRLLSGFLSDQLSCMPPTIRLKVCNSFAFLGAAGFGLGLSFVEDVTPTAVSIVLLCGVMFSCAFVTGGFLKAPLLMAPQHSAVISGLMSVSGMTAAIMMPFVVGSLAPKWYLVFYISTGMCVAGALVFLLFGSGTQQDWAKYSDFENEEQVEEKTRKRSIVSLLRF